jgi:hypothetical protein
MPPTSTATARLISGFVSGCRHHACARNVPTPQSCHAWRCAKLQALDAVCRLLASPTTPLLTLRFDVASREGAEAVAQALPHNARLLHLMLGGPVPEHVLSFIAARVSANTLSHLQHEANSTFVKSSQRPPALLPARPASANAFNSKRQTPSEPVASAVATASRSPPLRPASAGVLGSGGGAAVPQRRIVRSTTQQARQLSSLDMTGAPFLISGSYLSQDLLALCCKLQI